MKASDDNKYELPGATNLVPVQGAASMADLVQAKQCEPARRMVELTQGAASDDHQNMSHDEMQALCRVNPAVASGLPMGAASASEAKFGQGGATPDNSGPINHAEAYDLACLKRTDSNLARCYLELRAALAERAQAAQPSGAVTDVKAIHSAVLAIQPYPASKEVQHGFLTAIHRAAAVVSQFSTPAPEQEAAQTKSMFVVSMVLRQDAPGKVVMKPVMSYRVADTDDAAIGSAIKWATAEFPGWEVSSHQCVEVWKDETGQLAAQFTAPVPTTTPAEQPHGAANTNKGCEA